MDRTGMLSGIAIGGQNLPRLGQSARELGAAAVAFGSNFAIFAGGLAGVIHAGSSPLLDTALMGAAGAVAAALVSKSIVVLGPRAITALSAAVSSRRSDAAVAAMLPHAEALVAAMGGVDGPVARLDELGYLVWREPGADPVRMDRKEYASWRREIDATGVPLVVLDTQARADAREIMVCRYVGGRLEGSTLEAPAIVRIKADGSTHASYFELGAPVDPPEGADPVPVRR